MADRVCCKMLTGVESRKGAFDVLAELAYYGACCVQEHEVAAGPIL